MGGLGMKIDEWVIRESDANPQIVIDELKNSFEYD